MVWDGFGKVAVGVDVIVEIAAAAAAAAEGIAVEMIPAVGSTFEKSPYRSRYRKSES